MYKIYTKFKFHFQRKFRQSSVKFVFVMVKSKTHFMYVAIVKLQHVNYLNHAVFAILF